MIELKDMTDQQLREFMAMAEADNAAAASTQKDSDWHAACFAALYLACIEANSRGMKPQAVGTVQ